MCKRHYALRPRLWYPSWHATAKTGNIKTRAQTDRSNKEVSVSLSNFNELRPTMVHNPCVYYTGLTVSQSFSENFLHLRQTMTGR